MEERHAKDDVDGCIWQPSFICRSDPQIGIHSILSQSLMCDGNQIGRDVNADDLSATLDEGDSFFAGPAAKIQHSLVEHVPKQKESVFQWITCVGGRILISFKIHIHKPDLAGFRSTAGDLCGVMSGTHRKPSLT
jgi:hypothetical protein